MTAPPIASDVDLAQLPWFPILRRRLFTSTFDARATDTEWRAGVTLWIKSYDQRPAGSLPNDDAELWRLVDLKGNLRTWRRIRPMALHGWALCDDNRLYHPLISELVNSTKIRKESGKLNGNGGGNAHPFFELNGIPPPLSPTGTFPPPLNGVGKRRRSSPMTNLFEGAYRAAEAISDRDEAAQPRDCGD